VRDLAHFLPAVGFYVRPVAHNCDVPGPPQWARDSKALNISTLGNLLHFLHEKRFELGSGFGLFGHPSLPRSHVDLLPDKRRA